MNAPWKATNYKQDLSGLPVDWQAKPDLHWDEVRLALGFDPRGREISWGELSADWNGHLRGAAVLTGSQSEHAWFTIVEPEGLMSKALPYKIRRRDLHKKGELVAYEFALADPTTGAIYPASPRARCRVAQQVDCQRLFREQAKSWSRGEPVVW